MKYPPRLDILYSKLFRRCAANDFGIDVGRGIITIEVDILAGANVRLDWPDDIVIDYFENKMHGDKLTRIKHKSFKNYDFSGQGDNHKNKRIS